MTVVGPTKYHPTATGINAPTICPGKRTHTRSKRFPAVHPNPAGAHPTVGTSALALAPAMTCPEALSLDSLAPLEVGCVSPVAVDERLRALVKLYGDRWAIISAHMQVAFAITFPARSLERRWLALQSEEHLAQQRSPLAALSARSAVSESRAVDAGVPAQSSKRWREQTQEQMQPNRGRPPPPPSPSTAAQRDLLANSCPTFLLSPGSSLAAPDDVRKQLKACYLASLLNRSRQGEAEGPAGAGDTVEATDDPSSPPATRLASPSLDEKGAIIDLLARALTDIKPRSSQSSSSWPIGHKPTRSPCRSSSYLQRAEAVGSGSVTHQSGVATPPPQVASPTTAAGRCSPTRVNMFR